MTLPRIAVHPAHDFASLYADYALMVIAQAMVLPADLSARPQWLAILKRKGMKPAELGKTPLALDLPDGVLRC